jgi:hypothetical protein
VPAGSLAGSCNERPAGHESRDRFLGAASL